MTTNTKNGPTLSNLHQIAFRTADGTQHLRMFDVVGGSAHIEMDASSGQFELNVSYILNEDEIEALTLWLNNRKTMK